VGTPNEFVQNTIIKVKITKLKNATCDLNYGGAITQSKYKLISQPCVEGQTY